MSKPCCALRSRTLLNAAYFLLFLDALLFVAWVAGGFYLWVQCREELDAHVLIALHFAQAVSIMAVVTDWWANLKEKPHRLSDYAPLYWLITSLVSFFSDLFLFGEQFGPEEPEHCQLHLLHKVLDGTGLCICALSIVWFLFVYVYTTRARRHAERERQRVLEEAQNQGLSVRK
jgi:hypothetical protein